MSNKQDYEAKLDAINAIPNDQVQIPAMPVDIFLQEAEDTFHWSTTDAAKLATVGITQEMIDDIPVRAGALREAQSLWFKDRYSQEEAQQEWKIQSPEAFDLRDELLHIFYFAFRKDEVLLNRVRTIAEGDSNADMIQDLNDLSVLGKASIDAIKAVGAKPALLDQAATKADEMADLLAAANGDRNEQSETKTIRDKAYTHLKALIDEIRDAGKFLFWRNPDRHKGYVSKYWQQKNRTSTTPEPEMPEEPEQD
jgi:hypothetical protein